MTFGKALREARENRGWSRFMLCLKIKEAYEKEGVMISEDSVKDLELSSSRTPRGTTRAMFCRVLPELSFIQNETNRNAPQHPIQLIVIPR